jgi:hypothetical protein
MNVPENSENRSTRPDVPPSCFGDPKRVCPRDEDSFMQPQQDCVACRFLKACLQQALRAQGLIEAKSAAAPAVAKVSGFLRRWSERKSAETENRDRKTRP